MKIKFILFVICLAALIAFQSKVIMPYIYDIASSDLFLEDTGDDQNRYSEATFMTDNAYKLCQTYISEEELSDYSLTFAEKAINTFSLGNFQYVINADVEIAPTDGASFARRFVCRIKYLNGADKTEILNADNWDVNGISGLDNI